MSNIKKHIREAFRRYVNENNINMVDFKSFPPSVLKTLDNEYSRYETRSFDWNDKADEFDTPEEFGAWRAQNKSNQFIKQLNDLIKLTTEDIILIQKRKTITAKLDAFEELIKPTLGAGVLSPALSQFEREILMSPSATIEDIERGFREAKNIMDNDGGINMSKVTPSQDFTGGDINIPAFERLVNSKPEFQGVYRDWKKLSDEQMRVCYEENLNAFRNTTPIERIIELRTFLVNYKKQLG